MQRQPQPEAADAGERRLLADHDVEAEVINAGAAEALGDSHPDEPVPRRHRVELARHDPGALPVGVMRRDLRGEEARKLSL